MNSITKKWQEMANERLMLMQKLSAQHAETANLRAVMIKCADKLDDTFIEHPVADTLREAAK